ncbi:MAG: hypothetical protein KDE24_29655, partial [Caldilinea sp.]|nr:hypothetical protein [Caldilinea sp.]
MRAGEYLPQVGGYHAFVPKPLPPAPPIQLDNELTRLLSEADRALGRLDGVASVLPNPNLFVAMYVRQEAVLSSQIEGNFCAAACRAPGCCPCRSRTFPARTNAAAANPLWACACTIRDDSPLYRRQRSRWAPADHSTPLRAPG